jgi:hypothetical protein|tara:strand:+ start:359 stop:1156 length:798 start_codon:yes stop_codon:yes gene_type:complete
METTIIKYLLIVSLLMVWGCDSLFIEGPVGPQGEKGEQGKQGGQGYKGEQGKQGGQGYKGEQGEQGEQGKTPPVFSAYETFFNDVFDVDTWLKSVYGTWAIEDGELKVSGGVSDNFMALYPSREFGENYVIEVDTKWISGSNAHLYGIGVNLGGDGGYNFVITAGGLFRIMKWGDGGITVLHDWDEAFSVFNTEGNNNIGVSVANSTFTFSINGVEVATITDSEYLGGRVGLMVSGLQQVSFDNLSVLEMKIERSPLLKPIVTSQ